MSILVLTISAVLMCTPSVLSFSADADACMPSAPESSCAPGICSSALESSSVSSAKPKKELKTVVFKSHLHCKSCVAKVKENIAFEKGVKDLVVSLEDQTITVTYDPLKTSVEKLAAAIRKLGYNADVVE